VKDAISSPAVPRLDWLPPRLLLDGGVGTALIAQGLDLARETPEAWNLRFPEMVREVHRGFAAAGSQAVQTNSFGGNRIRLRAVGLENHVAELNLAALALARSAVPDGVLIVASMGPTGAVPPPEGDADLHELEEAFAEQAAAIAGAGPAGASFIHLESFYHPKELRAALRGCRAGAPDLPVAASFACNRAGSSYRSAMGFPVEALLGVALEERADAVGANCWLPPAAMLPLVEILLARSPVPVLAKPIVAAAGSAPPYPGEFAVGVELLFATGARAVGGCCGTSPADLAAVAGGIGDVVPVEK
jgi:5-methyltetrahydrofolate--homocysteine methyltransferase